MWEVDSDLYLLFFLLHRSTARWGPSAPTHTGSSAWRNSREGNSSSSSSSSNMSAGRTRRSTRGRPGSARTWPGWGQGRPRCQSGRRRCRRGWCTSSSSNNSSSSSSRDTTSYTEWTSNREERDAFFQCREKKSSFLPEVLLLIPKYLCLGWPRVDQDATRAFFGSAFSSKLFFFFRSFSSLILRKNLLKENKIIFFPLGLLLVSSSTNKKKKPTNVFISAIALSS